MEAVNYIEHASPRLIQDEDKPLVNKWLEDHGRKAFHDEMWPGLGFVVDDVAAGFVYLTDAKVGFVEGYVSNPKAKPQDVSRGIDDITSSLIETCDRAGVRRLVIMTRNESIAKRAKKFHFVEKQGDWKLLAGEFKK